ncbi:hypothetical protein C8Q77DRAFT_1048325 [Trametes polyzona]|nr:hypothetical protein C8Q77DRAFT_1048325 [Trametes polyzona]
MLIEATTTPAEDRPGPDGHPQPRALHPTHLHPSSRHRSPSPGRENYLTVPSQSQPGRSRAHSSVQMHPSPHAHGGAAQPGPLAVPGQVATYQTHIFAPPVTGAPVKKSKLSASGSSLSANGSMMTIGPTGSVISGPSSMGGTTFPAVNEHGQRLCRHCGQVGRYKEGKCVEKWGPGPEGPGTVCDRCRKKMKRVERRGTLDGHNLQILHPPAAIHPSGAPQPAPSSAPMNGRSSGSLHRSDTLHVHHSSSQVQTRGLAPTATHIISSSNSSPRGSYIRHERDREYERDRDHDASPQHSQYSSGSRPAQRSPPTPPYIATLPGSGSGTQEHDDAHTYDGSRATSRERLPHGHGHGHAHKHSIASMNGHGSASASGSASSRSASRSPKTHSGSGSGSAGAAHASGSAVGAAGAAASGTSPRGSDGKSKSSELMDVDADGEEVDADAEADPDADGEEGEGEGEADVDADAEADADADADAELLEAVDAAEANNATDEEWLKKEDA